MTNTPQDNDQVVSSDTKMFAHYRIEKELGRGGMGIVYKAFDTQLSRIVALKVLLAGSEASETDIKRFRRESEAAASLNHPNIVGVYAIGDYNDSPYFTMPFIEGVTLDKLIKRQVGRKKLLQIMEKVALALAHAHSHNIVHRDIKPSNILVCDEKEPYITDFGLAKKLNSGKSMLTQTGAALGTPFYMSPEQVSGLRDLDFRTDIYAMGVILYEILTSRLPFTGKSLFDMYGKILNENPPPPGEINPAVGKDLEYICLTAMAKKRDDRYKTAENLAQDIRHYLDKQPVSRTTKSLSFSLRKPGKILKLALIAMPPLLILISWQFFFSATPMPESNPHTVKKSQENPVSAPKISDFPDKKQGNIEEISKDNPKPDRPSGSYFPKESGEIGIKNFSVADSMTEGNKELSQQSPHTSRWKWKFNHGSAATFVDGRLFVSAGWHISAVDARNGEELWQFQTSSITLAPAFSDGIVYLTSVSEATCYALYSESGQIKWKFSERGTKNRIWANPVVDEQNVYFNYIDGRFYAVDKKTGQKKWMFHLSEKSHAWLNAHPVIQKGILYCCDRKAFYALSAKTGELQWKLPIAAKGACAVENNTVFIGDAEEHLYAIDLNTQTIRWKFRRDPLYPGAIVSNGVVYVGGNRCVYALDSVSGKEIWKLNLEGSISDLPTLAVYQNVLYIGTDEGTVHAMELKTHQVLWKMKTSQQTRWYISHAQDDWLCISDSRRLYLCAINMTGAKSKGGNISIEAEDIFIHKMTRIPNAVEGEQMRHEQRKGVTTQDMTVFSTGRWSGDKQLIWMADRRDQSLQLFFDAPEEGKYNIYGYFTKAYD